MACKSSSRADIARKKRDERREQNGYDPNAHNEEDAKRGQYKRSKEVKELHTKYVTLFKQYLEDKRNNPTGYQVERECQPPDLVLLKRFFRWYKDGAVGRLSEDKKVTARSTCACAERLFGGFHEETGTEIAKSDRVEIYDWIKKGGLKDVKDVRKPKFNFTKTDFMRTISSLWTRDIGIFIHGLLKVQIVFALQLFLLTGARIGAFVPSEKNRKERGLRFKDIELVLFQSLTEKWEIGWRVNQRWLKNNRNPNYTVFGIGIRDHNRPQFASGILLLVIALAHNALFDINSFEDLEQFDLRDGKNTEIPLRWKNDALDKPVFRDVTTQGPQEGCLGNLKFNKYLRLILIAAGYWKQATVHDIRRALGTKIEAKRGSAPVSQIYAHKSPSTYPEHYQAHCSSIDTVGDVMDEEDKSTHIEYFQGYRQFLEEGLPQVLPAQVFQDLLQHPALVAIMAKIQVLQEQEDFQAVANKRREYSNTLKRLLRSELPRYQTQWVRDRRDWRIKTRGQEDPDDPERDVQTRPLYLIMPELQCIAAAFSSAEPLSFDQKLIFGESLLAHCRHDYDAIYLPGEQPINGKCPSLSCQQMITQLSAGARSHHIHNCMKKEMVLNLQISESELHYCYECMEWLQDTEWNDHCDYHLKSWTSLHCEVVTYHNTVIRPGYCPCCLNNADLLPKERLRYWLRSQYLRDHIRVHHMRKVTWPTTESICGCEKLFQEEKEFRHHLHDMHGLTHAIWSFQDPKYPIGKRKRRCELEKDKSNSPKTEPVKKRIHLMESNKPTVCEEQCPPSSVQIPDNNDEDISSVSVYKAEMTESSTISSPLSLRPSTPDLELIDPRILEEQDLSPWNEMTSSSSCTERHGTSNEKTPVLHNFCRLDTLSTQDRSSGSKYDTDIKEQPSHNISEPRSQINNNTSDCASRELLAVNSPPNFLHSVSVRRVTRAKSKEQHVSSAKRPRGGPKGNSRLTPSERKKLLELKSQHMTWRKILSHFPGKDLSTLQQVCSSIQPVTQRCTRSRVKKSSAY